MHAYEQKTHWQRFLKQVPLQTKFTLSLVFAFIRVAFITIFGIVLFLLGFEAMKNIVGFFIGPLVLYFVGTHFTHLPLYLILFLAFLPGRIVIPIYFVAFVVMFLI